MMLYTPPKKQFLVLPNAVFDMPLDVYAFKIYAYLVCCAGNRGECWPTMHKMSKKLGTTVHPYCITRKHHRYVECEMDIKLWRHRAGSKKNCKNSVRYIKHYRQYIINLIPTAQYWPPEYWLNEHHIFDEILRVHNVD